MTNCERCGETMKPLFSSSYCPNECDRRAPVPTAFPPVSALALVMDGWEAYHFPAGTRLTDASWATHGLWVNPDQARGLERTREVLLSHRGGQTSPWGSWRINSAEHGRFVVQKFSENGLGLALFRRVP